MKYFFIYMAFILYACNTKTTNPSRDSLIESKQQQQMLYEQLAQLVPGSLPGNDSISFMVLPLEASCPSCRDKSLDSIVRFKNSIPSNHYIILSLKGGRKYVRQYFKNAGHKQIPDIPGVLFIDSIDKAGEFQLYHNNPSFYYAVAGNTYRKIDALPHTVKEDLREFFRGYRLKSE
ncbi:hypothetical protein [Chitinophaga barathri]|uniref:Uncharacterized protein n=1 Tax=Chitinophaga barathri TaxID=1647451 RepID=A0A3N4MQ97_9BACT|nr:hypothetical protein [Chitinophaga barathri]RPD41849.1 hypothetical protein EG028_06705 [Chitinophaga barathri]